ncbi:diguanylate cyclase [Qipengyuania sp. GH25]|uniref:diguanylate cyclase n=1 Tax=Qipengyuania pacifica TaxID=2860199 RepID=A0ABS7JJF3_9SPHN|nr:sensor domain-containing diguanylate cyclase [Qipengyuania aerophila]MBX7489549.1 diguanylate cyclase [Qipengyuania aerophila]
MISPRSNPRNIALLRPLFTGLGYFTAALITLRMVDGINSIAIIWPASGLLLAVLLLRKNSSAYPHVLSAGLGSLAANVIDNGALAISAGYTAANMFEPLAIAWILKVKLARRLSFSSPQHLMWFSVAALLGCACSATIANTVTAAASAEFWFSWFSTDLLGILIVTPLLMVAHRAFRNRGIVTVPSKVIEATAIFALIGTVSWVTFYHLDATMLFLQMFVVLTAASRLGPLGAAGGILVIACVGGLSFDIWTPTQTSFGTNLRGKSLYFQFYLLTLFAASLPIAALLAERDRILARLGEEKRLLQLAEDNADLGHWWLDVDTQTIRWSRGVFTIFGLEEGIPPPLEAAIDAYHPDDRHVVTDHIEKAIEDRQGFEFRARIIRPDGQVRYVRSRGELDHQSDRDRVGLFGIVQDVTQQVTHEFAIIEARKRAEEAAFTAKVLAETDQLTQIPNRRRVTEDLTRAVTTSKSEGNPVSVALFDIDYFKRVNDTFGHQAGDDVLKRVAKTTTAAVRVGDVVGRFGGEEFIIVLPNTNSGTAMVIAERVRVAIEDVANTPAVTISVGVAELTHMESVESLLQRADQALYKAKREGRNTLRLAA